MKLLKLSKRHALRAIAELKDRDLLRVAKTQHQSLDFILNINPDTGRLGEGVRRDENDDKKSLRE